MSPRDEIDVTLVIGQYQFCFRLYPLQQGGKPVWRAARLNRMSDGSFGLSRFPNFRQGTTPGQALAQAAATVVDQVLWDRLPQPVLPPGEPPMQTLPPVTAPTPTPMPPSPGPRPDGTPGVPAQPEPAPEPARLSRQERAAQLADTIETAISRLAQQLADGHSEEFLELLAFYSRFHRYSINNCLLIRSQCPDATQVAGLRRWNALGYSVQKGEKAIWIWVPMVRKELDSLTGEEVEHVVGFRPAPVFDASQLAEIDDKPLPTLFRPLPDDVEDLYWSVKARIEADGIAVEEGLLPAGVQGASRGGQIVIRAGLDSGNRLAVLLHELAHELAHQGDDQRAKARALRELEAEAAAHVVGAVLGLAIPTSRDYLLSYGITAEVLTACFGTIQRLVRQLLTLVEGDAAAETETQVEAA